VGLLNSEENAIQASRSIPDRSCIRRQAILRRQLTRGCTRRPRQTFLEQLEPFRRPLGGQLDGTRNQSLQNEALPGILWAVRNSKREILANV